MHRECQRPLLVAGFSLLLAVPPSAAQTLSPPIAEYRGSGNGVMELRNDGDIPLVAILELRGFSVDTEGNLRYTPLDSLIHVDLGSNSFTIPPHQSHYVFYKASSPRQPFWFTIMNTMTTAKPVAGGLRVNIVLPHLVYVYQKSRLKKNDVLVRVLPTDSPREYRLEVQNLSEKLSRVAGVECKGFAEKQTYGGFPLFPGQVRRLLVKAGPSIGQAKFRIKFEDGFRLDEALPMAASLRALLQ